MSIKYLKGQKTKLLKSNPENEEQFEQIQEELNKVEFQMIKEECKNV